MHHPTLTVVTHPRPKAQEAAEKASEKAAEVATEDEIGEATAPLAARPRASQSSCSRWWVESGITYRWQVLSEQAYNLPSLRKLRQDNDFLVQNKDNLVFELPRGLRYYAHNGARTGAMLWHQALHGVNGADALK